MDVSEVLTSKVEVPVQRKRLHGGLGLLAISATKHGAEMPEELKEPGPRSYPGRETRFADTATLVAHTAEPG